MKIWLFAVVQSSIALVGFTAYFYAGIPIVAAAAGVLAVIIVIAQVLLSAKSRVLSDGGREPEQPKILKKIDAGDSNGSTELTDPPLPHRSTVAVLCREAFPDAADDLLARYDEVIAAIEEKSEDAERGADCLAADLPSESLGHYLCGLGALAQDNDEGARDYFAAATTAQSDWAEAWLGWAAACYRLEEFAELVTEHPSACGVKLAPCDCGNEAIRSTLPESDRAELATRFKQTSVALKSYAAAAKNMRRSRRAKPESQQERRKSA